jgi:hypothetical protein
MRIRTLMHALLVLVVLLVSGQIIATWRRPFPVVAGEGEAPSPPPPDGGEGPANLTPEASNALVTIIAQNDLFSPDRGVAPPPPPDKAPR